MFNDGRCLSRYYDTRGIPTIGVGFNLRRSDASQAMSRYGLTLAKVLKDCTDKATLACLSEDNARDLFNSYVYPEMEKCADAYTPDLPAVKRAAVIDVAFAGCATLNKFKNMQSALKNQDWKTAAAELRNSAWCSQVKENRCNSDYNCCESGRCRKYKSCSSSNPECLCFSTSNGNGFCASNFYCRDYPDCKSCSPKTLVYREFLLRKTRMCSFIPR